MEEKSANGDTARVNKTFTCIFDAFQSLFIIYYTYAFRIAETTRVDVDNEVKMHITNRIKSHFFSRSYRALAAKEAKQYLRMRHLAIVDTLQSEKKRIASPRTVPRELWSSVIYYLKQSWNRDTEGPLILASIFSYAAYYGEIFLATEVLNSKNVDAVNINLQEAWLILRKAIQAKQFDEAVDFSRSLE